MEKSAIISTIEAIFDMHIHSDHLGNVCGKHDILVDIESELTKNNVEDKTSILSIVIKSFENISVDEFELSDGHHIEITGREDFINEISESL